jgi:nucleoside-diphosphate-sugar epimerase
LFISDDNFPKIDQNREIDIRDLAALTPALEGASVILHHAAISSVPRSFQDQATTHDVNATGTQNLLTAAGAAGVERVIYASSSAVYGNDTADLQRESTLPAPCSPYGLSKWLAEVHTLKFTQTTAMETIALRIAHKPWESPRHSVSVHLSGAAPG